jgi:hypothetical protein
MVDYAVEMGDHAVKTVDDVTAKGHAQGQVQVEVVGDAVAKKTKKVVAGEEKVELGLCAARVELGHCNMLELAPQMLRDNIRLWSKWFWCNWVSK